MSQRGTRPPADDAGMDDPNAPSSEHPTRAEPFVVTVPPPSDDLPTGTQVGSYVVLSQIGRGGCSTVYAVAHVVLGRRAVLKVLLQDIAASPTAVKRFVREARASSMIGHPNIVDIFDIGQLANGPPYYIMELLEGPNLEQLVRARGRMSPEDAVEMITPVCEALMKAHETGVIHRDIKPSNIVVATRDGNRVVKVIDFGIAKLVDRRDGRDDGLTREGQRLGTPIAMAPEQIRGDEIDRRVDIYALGVTLFFALTGRYPFQAATPTELEQMHLNTPAPKPSALAPVGPRLEAVVLATLEKDRERRPRDTATLLAALREAIGAQAITDRRSAHALAVYLEITPVRDAGLDRAALLLDRAERTFTAAGGRIAMRAATTLLSVWLINGVNERLELDRIVSEVEGLYRALVGSAASDLLVTLCFDRDEVTLTEGGQLEGRLNSIDWVPFDLQPGAWAFDRVFKKDGRPPSWVRLVLLDDAP